MTILNKAAAWRTPILATLALAIPVCGLRAQDITITINPSEVVTAQDGSTFFSVLSVYQIDTMEGQTNVPLTLMNQYEISTGGLVAPSAANGPFPQAYTPTVLPGVYDTVGSFFSFVQPPVGFNLFLDAADKESPVRDATLEANGTPFDIGLVSTSNGQSVDVTIDDERTRISNVPDQMSTFLALGLGIGTMLILGMGLRLQDGSRVAEVQGGGFRPDAL